MRECAVGREFLRSLYFHWRSLQDDPFLECTSKPLSLMTLPEVGHLSESCSQVLTLGRGLPTWKPICVSPFSSIGIWHILWIESHAISQKQTLLSKPYWKKYVDKKKSLGHLNYQSILWSQSRYWLSVLKFSNSSYQNIYLSPFCILLCTG